MWLNVALTCRQVAPRESFGLRKNGKQSLKNHQFDHKFFIKRRNVAQLVVKWYLVLTFCVTWLQEVLRGDKALPHIKWLNLVKIGDLCYIKSSPLVFKLRHVDLCEF